MAANDETTVRPRTPNAGVRIWDIPVRLFHWALVICVAISIFTGEVGGLWQMNLHVTCGCVALGLVLFRLIWGIVGGRHARFAAFVTGPRRVIAEVRSLLARRLAHSPGHNPLGGWSVVAMLAVLAAQAGTGLFANDDIFVEGPLFHLVGKQTSNLLTGVHEAIATVLFILIGLHVAAVALHWWHGDNLVRPMITGRKAAADPQADDPRERPVAFVVAVVIAVGAVLGILRL